MIVIIGTLNSKAYSFHVNSNDPGDINAFVEVMNNFAQDNEQRSYVVTKYIGKMVADQLGKPGKNGGIIDPGIMIKFKTPLNEDQKISVVKLAQKHGLPGLSIADDGSYAVAYKSGELYGNETPITFANKAKAFEEEFGIGSGEGLSGVGGAVSPFMQELWTFTSDAGNNSTATYQQVRSSLAKASREVSVLQRKHVKQINTKGKTGKELAKAQLHNAMAAGGMEQNVIDATIAIVTDVVDRFIDTLESPVEADEVYAQYKIGSSWQYSHRAVVAKAKSQ